MRINTLPFKKEDIEAPAPLVIEIENIIYEEPEPVGEIGEADQNEETHREVSEAPIPTEKRNTSVSFPLESTSLKQPFKKEKPLPSFTENAPTPLLSYEEEVSAWFRRHQLALITYASSHYKTGILYIEINEDGVILSSFIYKSTHDAELDILMKKIAWRANPVPPVPDLYPRKDKFIFLIPLFF